MRLNYIDHYQAIPSDFDPPLPYRNEASKRGDQPKVPVIRAFGTTETGQKVCVHVHGAFPYLYVGYDGTLNPEEGLYGASSYIFKIAKIPSGIGHPKLTSFHRPCLGGELSSQCL